ncbi:MAG: hypothetical protein RIQ33_411 [Bacteroidota bacterium]|jgi:hypothetical protein
MEAHTIIFFSVGIVAIGFLVYAFSLFVKRLGLLGGDFKLLADNYRIIMPMVTMLIFAVMMALLLYIYQSIYHDLFNF